MRADEKDLPDKGKGIVFYSGGIRVGIATERNGKPCVCPEAGKRIDIKTGFLWCYQNDIPVPREI